MYHSSPSDFDKPRQMLEHLVERAKRHPVPYAWLANWYVLKVNRGWSQNAISDTQSALDYARRALELEPNNSLALTIDGFAHTNLKKDTVMGQQRYQDALQANPNDSLAWLLKGTMHAFRGEGKEAMDGTTHALMLSPLDPLRYFYESLAATAALANSNYELALSLAKKSLRSNRMHTSTWRALTVAYVGLGQIDEAKEAGKRLLDLDPNFSVTKFLNQSPSANYSIGNEWSKALALAGLPN
jgi:adenylate cyclase